MENTKFRTVLPTEQTGLFGLTLFGHATQNKAELPMLNHYHKDKMEFVILVDGMQKFSASDVSYTLYQNDVFITQPSEIHSSGEPLQEGNELLWFQLDLSQTDRFLNLSEPDALRLIEKLMNFDGRKFSIGRRLTMQFKESFLLLESENSLKKMAGRSEFIYCLINMLSRKAEVVMLSDDIDRAKQYILLHLHETIDMDELDMKSGLTHGKFKERFQNQIGISPREYIKAMKIDSAKDMVANTNESIENIAFSYNFSSKRHFVKTFKYCLGKSPKQYRNEKKHSKENK